MKPSLKRVRMLFTHQDQVEKLPPGARLLGSADHCPHAMFAMGNHILALQPHPEVSKALGQEWNPESPYYVIEVNPRVSRSSALASKATGYPIARVAAKIAVGKKLDEIENAVTKQTTAAFEPALDYCVLKIPRWPFDKFPHGDRRTTTQMKATGEVMVIERSFEAALQKGARSLELSGRTLLWEDPAWRTVSPADGEMHLDKLPLGPNDERLWGLMSALRQGVPVGALVEHTYIEPWFINALERIVKMERRLLGEELTPSLLKSAKRMGFSDIQVGILADMLPEQVRNQRHEWGLKPVYKTVDTCAAEFEAVTPYYYSTYDQENEAPPLEGKKAVVIGSGPIRIGQGIEFDYCSVHASWALSEAGVRSIMVNSNPETVSTDFDASDRLYFEPLDEESVRDILENEESVRKSISRRALLEQAVKDLPERQGEASERQSEVTRLLSELGPEWDISRLESIDISLPVRGQVSQKEAWITELDQTAAGLAVDLGGGECLLRLHQLLLHLLRLREECGHIGLALALRLHASSSWSCCSVARLIA